MASFGVSIALDLTVVTRRLQPEASIQLTLHVAHPGTAGQKSEEQTMDTSNRPWRPIRRDELRPERIHDPYRATFMARAARIAA